jgi:serine/threonine protein kinase
MVLELCSHGDLCDLLFRRKRLTEPEVRYYAIQILDAVQYMHSKLVLHRDIKLENILIQTGMRTKIADFGLAIQLSNEEELLT